MTEKDTDNADETDSNREKYGIEGGKDVVDAVRESTSSDDEDDSE